MSKRAAKKAPLVDVDIGKVREALERAETALPSEDHRLLAGVVDMLVELTKQIRSKSATIARLRSWVGFTSTEKTKDVLGAESGNAEEAGTCGEAQRASSRQAPAGGGEACDSHASEHAASEGKACEGAPGEACEGTTGKGQACDGKPKRKGHGRLPASAYEAEHIDVPHQQFRRGDRCPGCERGNLCRRDAVQWLRIFGRSPLAATCWDCESLRCNACGEIYTAVPPEQALGPKYSESAGSMIALLRYGIGTPFHRLGQLQGHLHVPVPAATQWEVVFQQVAAVSPVYERLRQRAADGSLLHSDDTYMRILEFMGKRRAKLLAKGELPSPERTGLHTTAIVSITGDGPIALFVTGRKHAGENLDTLLDNRHTDLEPPLLMCDGLQHNHPKRHTVVECNCLVHGRRKFVELLDSFPSECRHMIEKLADVFENEAHCKKEGLTGVVRRQYHIDHSQPVLTELEGWMKTELEQRRVEPNSPLGGAFKYLLKRWDKLTRFLHVLDAPLENNLCERVLKMALRHRNNSKFYRTQRGANVGDIYMTLIHTALLHHENPFEYLTALMVHYKLVAAHPDDWLPWTFRASLERLAHPAAMAA